MRPNGGSRRAGAERLSRVQPAGWTQFRAVWFGALGRRSRQIAIVRNGRIGMRKVVAIENATLDGFADSQEGLGFEWTARAYDEEVDRYGNEHVRADVDTAIYGRATYLGMQGFWSNMLDNPDGTPDERAHAEWVHNVPKIVFSTTLESADWANMPQAVTIRRTALKMTAGPGSVRETGRD